MANDRGGNPISVGDVVTVAGKVVKIDGTRVVVATERGPVSVEAGETYPIDTLAAGGGGGVTDHGALTGLADDDHTQYHNDTRGDARYYTKSQIDTSLAGKAELAHTHGLSDIIDAGSLAGKNTIATADIDNDAVTYAKVQNVSATDRILGRATAGAGDIEEITCTAAGRALLDDANASAQRITLGLGSAAVEDVSAFEEAGTVSTHAAVTSGVHGISAFGASLVDDADAAAARTTLGLGGAATASIGSGSGQVAAGDHTHVLADVTDAGGLASLDAVDTAQIADDAVTLAKLANLPPKTIIGNWFVFDGPPLALTSSQARSTLELTAAATASFGDGAGEITEGNDARLIPTRLHPWLTALSPSWMFTQLTGWTQAASGSGTSYLTSGRFWGPAQQSEVGTVLLVETGTATSGTNACVRFINSANGLWLPNGRVMVFRIAVSNLAQVQTMRVGFFGNGANPAASTRPAAGVWLEYDRAVSATNWYLCAGAASTYSTADTGTAVDDTTAWVAFALEFVSTADVRAYLLTTSAATQIAQVTTNVPSTDQQRSGGMMAQIVKLTTGPAATRGNLFIDRIGPLLDDSALPVTP